MYVFKKSSRITVVLDIDGQPQTDNQSVQLLSSFSELIWVNINTKLFNTEGENS